MRIPRALRLHVPGWTGPLVEDAEPDVVAGTGALDDGLNVMAQAGRRRTVRGGSRVVTTFAAVGGNAITNCWGPFRYSATGAVAVGHASAGSKHYAYALTDTLGWMGATEALSRGDLSWNTATAARPYAVELFEKVYFVDATESGSTRNGMSVGTWSAGAWSVSQPVYDLDGSGSGTGALKAYSAEVFNGVLFVSGYDSESAPSSGSAPHLLRHSLLGTDPSTSGGFDPNAYLILGAKGQFVRAMKSGRTVMLVAKDSELYTISGSGHSLPGWQYQVQQVSNSLGAGCTNPYALDHAYGMWYGIGRVGPWRTDGGNVELLRAGRDRSWSRVQNLQLATVTAHPDRRQVWYGFHEVGRTGYQTGACTFWVWDLEREQWDVSQRTNRSYTFLGTVLQGATVAPSGAPGAPTQDFTAPAYDFDALEVTFTPADASALTEVWYRPASGGAYALHSSVREGVTRALIDGLQGTTAYYVKLRHNRGGAVSDYSSEVLCYTRVESGYVIAGQTQTTDSDTNARTILSATTVSGVDVTVVDNGSPAYSASYSAEPAGVRVATDTSPFGIVYTLSTSHASWPVSYKNGLSRQSQQRVPSSTTPPAPTQDLSGTAFALTSIGMYFWPNKHATTYALYMAPSSTGVFALKATLVSAPLGTALSSFGINVPGLTAGETYTVKITDTSTGIDSSTVAMYTKLPAPSAVVVTSTGSGTPGINIAVTIAAIGHQLDLYNTDRTYTNVATPSLSIGTYNYTTTAGACGVPDRYWVRTYNSAWPDGYRYSDAVSDDVTNPCVVGS